MKKIYILFAITITSYYSLFAQSPCNLNGFDGANNIPLTTDFNNTNWSNPPYNQVWKKNTGTNRFDWTDSVYAINPNINNYKIKGLGHITPLFRVPSIDYASVARAENSDFRPQDGWELVKKNFGWKADGTDYLYSLSPYLLLYNKYSSILRVISWLQTIDGNSSYYEIRLKFRDGSNKSGLLNFNAAYALPMDKYTKTTAINAVSLNSSNSSNPIYADFQLAYDPCTCLFESDILVEFRKINKAEIKLQGKFLGTLTPVDIVNDNNYKGYLSSYSKTSANSDNNVSGGIVKYYQDTKDVYGIDNHIDQLVSDIKTTVNNQSAISPLNIFSTVLKIGSAIYNPGEAALLINAGGIPLGTIESIPRNGSGLKKGLEYASQGVNFLSSLWGNGANSSPIPSVVHGEMQLSGTATTINDLPDENLLFANPGSKNSQTKPEFYNLATGQSAYPMYNEVLGTFALMKTPSFDWYLQYAQSSFQFQDNHLTCSNMYHATTAFKLSEKLEYIFNPALDVDITNTEILGSIQAEISSDLDILNDNQINTQYYSFCKRNLKFIRYEDINKKSIYTSELIPIEQLQNLNVGFDFGQIYPARQYFYFNTDVYLKLVINIQFKKNKQGKINKTTLILKYPIKFNSQPNNSLGNIIYYNDPNLPPYSSNRPYTFVVDSSTIGNGGMYLNSVTGAMYDVKIVGTPKKLSNKQYFIRSLKGNINVSNDNYNVNNDIILSDEIILEQGMPIIKSDPIYNPPLTQSDVTAKCTKGSTKFIYSSYAAERLAFDEEASIEAPKPSTIHNTTHLTAIPNPATGSTTFYFNVAEESTTVQLYITDIMGKKVADVLLPQTRTQGTYQENFDIGNLAKGIYLFSLQTSTSKETQRLIVE